MKSLKGVPPPKPGETQEQFYARCMGNPGMNVGYPNEEQRSAMCTARWQEPGNPSGAEDEKDIGKDVLDIRDGDIDWGRIMLEKKIESLTTEQVSEQIMSAIRESIREAASAEAQAAINRLTGRLD